MDDFRFSSFSPVEFKRISNFNNTITTVDDNDEDWLTLECLECLHDDSINTCCSNENTQKPYKKHYPPKSKDLIPGFSVPVEVCTCNIP